MNGATRRERLARARLYLVIEARPHGREPDALLAAALRGGVDIVQLRDKELRDDELVRAAASFRRACDAYGALFVLNDRPDLVEACGADGVHVGQDDEPARECPRARRRRSCSSGSRRTRRAEMDAATGADYIGVGTIFATPTKPESSAAGLELVRTASEAARVPWFAIGGIELANVGARGGGGCPWHRRRARDPRRSRPGGRGTRITRRAG